MPAHLNSWNRLQGLLWHGRGPWANLPAGSLPQPGRAVGQFDAEHARSPWAKPRPVRLRGRNPTLGRGAECSERAGQCKTLLTGRMQLAAHDGRIVSATRATFVR